MSKPFRKKLWDGWMRFGHIIGTFNTRVILSVIYFVIVALYAIPHMLISLLSSKRKLPSWNSKPLIKEPRRNLDRQF